MSPRKMRRTKIAAAVSVALVSGGALLPSVSSAQRAAQERPEEIIVTSSIIEQPRRQIGTAVSVIEFEDIELRGYSDLSNVLRTQTGIAVSNTGGPGKSTALRIRGEEAYRTVLMIDGVKSVDPSGSQAAPGFDSLLSTNDFERVEILRGPQGFMYGADAGGVVSIITKRGEGDLGGKLGIEAGEFSTRKIDGALSGGSDNGDYYVSVTDLETDGFNARTTDTVLRDDDGADNTTVHAKVGWNATENLRLQLVARDIDASTLFDGCSFPTVHDCSGTTEQTTYKLSADYNAGDFGNVFGYSDVDIARDNFAAGVSSFAYLGELSRLEYTGSYRASDATTLVYGLDIQDEKMRDSSGPHQRDQDGYYVEYQGEFGDNFFLSVGARYDDNEDFGSHTSGRVSAAYVQDLGQGNSLKYRASLGTGFRAPSLYEVAYNQRAIGVLPAAAATALVEESSEGYDIGVEYNSVNDFRFEATYFDQEIEDQIGYLSDASFNDGYVQTAGTSVSDGIELAIEAPLTDRFAILANWTHNDAETSTGAQRLRRPKNLGNLGLMFTPSGDAFRFIANYRLSRDAIDFGDVPLDDYEVLDLSMAYSFNDSLELNARIENATDEEYQEVLTYNSSDRAAYAGVKLRF